MKRKRTCLLELHSTKYLTHEISHNVKHWLYTTVTQDTNLLTSVCITNMRINNHDDQDDGIGPKSIRAKFFNLML